MQRKQDVRIEMNSIIMEPAAVRHIYEIITRSHNISVVDSTNARNQISSWKPR